MRILVVADYYRHGAGRIIEDRAAALARRGHRVTLLAGTDPDRLDVESAAARARGLEPELLPYTAGGRGPLALWRLVRGFRRACDRLSPARRFDAMLLYQPLSSWGVLSSRLSRRTPACYTFLSPWADEWAVQRGKIQPGGRRAISGLRCRLEFNARLAIERWVLARCERITYLSGYSRSQIAELHPHVPAERLALIPGGVDLSRFTPLDEAERRARKASLGLPPDAPILLTVRRLVPRMGLENLLVAFQWTAAEIPDLRLWIGGSGPLAETLRARVRDLGIDGRVRLLGYVPEPELPGLYAAADLFVLPTVQLEGFGLVTVEALACGTLVVGTPIGATPEVLGGIDPQLLATSTAAESLAEALGRVLRMPEGERAELRRLARRRTAERYDAEKVGDALEALLGGISGGVLRAAAGVTIQETARV